MPCFARYIGSIRRALFTGNFVSEAAASFPFLSLNAFVSDIKPSNFLANATFTDFALVDFGLAEMVHHPFPFCRHI